MLDMIDENLEEDIKYMDEMEKLREKKARDK